MTTVADGLFQYGGMPVGMGLSVNKIFSAPNGFQKKGRAWFVDAAYGGDGNGRSPEKAFATMGRAFDNVASGDIIYFVGKVQEQLVTPVQIFDVTVVGCGNRPRHADSTPAGGNWAASQWGAPASGAVAGQATVRVLQQGWRFMNILFTMQGTTAAGVEVVRNAGAGDAERDGSHCEILGCRFSGAGVGVRSGVAGLFTEIAFNVKVQGNTFNGNTLSMSGAAGFGGNAWQIFGNVFWGNTANITMALANSFIVNNYIGPFTPSANSGGIDLNGGTAGNVVTLNYLSGTYSEAGGYRAAGGGDEWAANMNVISGGWTAADPT
jgi:hypothetical protein